MKKFVSMLAGVVMASSMFAVSAYAAGNVTFSVDKTEVLAGEDVVFTINSLEKYISTEGFFIEFENDKFDGEVKTFDGFDCTAVTNGTGGKAVKLNHYSVDDEDYVDTTLTKSDPDIANSEGSVGFGKNLSADDCHVNAKNKVALVTFTAPVVAEDTEFTFTLGEDSSGQSGYKGTVDTITVTVKAPAQEPTVTWKEADASWVAPEGKKAIWWPFDYEANTFPGHVFVEVTDGTRTETIGIGANADYDVNGAVSFAVAVILDAEVDATNFDCVVK